MKPWVRITAVCVVLGGATTAVSPVIELAGQLRLLDSLVTVSGIVLGVAGAWFALVFPRTLAQLQHPSRPGEADDATYLLGPMLVSAAIIALAVLLRLFEPLLNQIPWSVKAEPMVLRALFGIVAAACFAQVWTLVTLALPAAVAEEELNGAEKKQRFAATFSSPTRRSQLRPREPAGR